MKNQRGNVVVSLLAGAVGAVLILLLAPTMGWLSLPALTPAAAPAGINQIPLSPGSTHEKVVVAAVQKASPSVVSIVLTADVPVV
jgi:hypothetical protein